MDAPSGSIELTMDEMETMTQEPATPAGALTGDNIPEELRGKSLAEIAESQRRTMEALRISEQARLAALEARANAPVPAAPAAPAPEAPPAIMTEAEFNAMYETDPGQALRLYSEQREALIMANVMARFAPMQAGAASAAEAQARVQFKDEFALFEAEIKATTDKIPNKSFLASPEGWEQVISYIRGQPKNFDKLIAHKATANQAAVEAAARAAQQANVGFQPRTNVASTPVPGNMDPTHHGLDETERRVADTLRQSYAEFAKWKRTG